MGDRRIELLTSSVSRKRSTSELTTRRTSIPYVETRKNNTRNSEIVKFTLTQKLKSQILRPITYL